MFTYIITFVYHRRRFSIYDRAKVSMVYDILFPFQGDNKKMQKEIIYLRHSYKYKKKY